MKRASTPARWLWPAVVALVVTIVAGLLALGVPTDADAESDYNVTFRIKSRYTYRIQVAFYAQHRNVVWPGGNRAYEIDNSRVHEYTLRCRPNERICYGGWVEGRPREYWGVGYNNKQRCTTCCYRCEDQTTQLIVLE